MDRGLKLSRRVAAIILSLFIPNIVSVCFLAGCSGMEMAYTSDFDPPVDFCVQDEGGHYPVQISLTSSSSHSPLFPGDTSAAFASGNGCIMEPIERIWARTVNPEFMIWDGADLEGAIVRLDGDPEQQGNLFSYELALGNLVDWTMKFFHTYEPVERGADPCDPGRIHPPRKVEINFQMVSSSWADALSYWKGVVILRRIDPQVTHMYVWVSMDSMRDDDYDRDAMEDLVASLFDTAMTLDPFWDELGMEPD